MKIKELIKELRKYPQDAVVETGYKGHIASVVSVAYWEKDRNSYHSVMLMHPLTGPMIVNEPIKGVGARKKEE